MTASVPSTAWNNDASSAREPSTNSTPGSSIRDRPRIIGNDERPHRTAVGQQPFGDVAADTPAGAGDKNAHPEGSGSGWENQLFG